MHRHAWFPVGYDLPIGCKAQQPLFSGDLWQIQEPYTGWRILVVREALCDRWIAEALFEEGKAVRFAFGPDRFAVLDGTHLPLEPLASAHAPETLEDALRGARAYRATCAIAPDAPLQDSIYIAAGLRFLPTFGTKFSGNPAVAFTAWLTGGVPVPLDATERLQALTPWDRGVLLNVLETAGLKPRQTSESTGAVIPPSAFRLVGRPELELFFNEHIIDIVRNEDRYKALGINFPGAIALHGPPGCGKTFAVEKLLGYLGWPSFPIDASTIGSPYIHETSRKVAATFEEAARTAPSVIVIDEMDAFLAERQAGISGQHRVEEVAEFLRRLADAPKHKVLVIGMTNRIEAIDSAILRRGRFDHVIKVDMASEAEVSALLNTLINALPHEPTIPTTAIAARFAGRPLSDVAFLVREAARRSARDGSETLTAQSINDVLASFEPSACRQIL